MGTLQDLMTLIYPQAMAVRQGSIESEDRMRSEEQRRKIAEELRPIQLERETTTNATLAEALERTKMESGLYERQMPYFEMGNIPQSMGESALMDPRFRELVSKTYGIQDTPPTYETPFTAGDVGKNAEKELGFRKGQQQLGNIMESVTKQNLPGTREGQIEGKKSAAMMPAWREQMSSELQKALAVASEHGRQERMTKATPSYQPSPSPADMGAYYREQGAAGATKMGMDPKFQDIMTSSQQAMASKDPAKAREVLFQISSMMDNIKFMGGIQESALPAALGAGDRAGATNPYQQLMARLQQEWERLYAFWQTEDKKAKERKWWHWDK